MAITTCLRTRFTWRRRSAFPVVSATFDVEEEGRE
jgi:hypothetical protein